MQFSFAQYTGSITVQFSTSVAWGGYGVLWHITPVGGMKI